MRTDKLWEQLRVRKLTGLENLVELWSRNDCETVGNDRVRGVVAVVVDEDFAGGRHVGGVYVACEY